jgi:hypothetical protein
MITRVNLEAKDKQGAKAGDVGSSLVDPAENWKDAVFVRERREQFQLAPGAFTATQRAIQSK